MAVNKKKLRVANPPPFTFLLYPAYRTSILLANNKASNWFFSSFVQFSCDKFENNNFGVEFIVNPFFVEVEINYKTNNFDKTINRIINSINRGVYLSLTWNESLISCRPNYDGIEYKHMVMVYGYDLERKLFNIIGYSERNVFEENTISFEEFEKAYKYYKKSRWKFYINKPWVRRKFSFKRFNRQLYWYKTSKYPLLIRLLVSHSLLRNKCFGLATYDCLLYRLKCEYVSNTVSNDVFKALTAYYEHKKYLKESFLYMKNITTNRLMLDDIINCYAYLEKQFMITRNMYIKYSQTKSKDIVVRIINIISLLNQKEAQILKEYFEID